MLDFVLTGLRLVPLVEPWITLWESDPKLALSVALSNFALTAIVIAGTVKWWGKRLRNRTRKAAKTALFYHTVSRLHARDRKELVGETETKQVRAEAELLLGFGSQLYPSDLKKYAGLK
ncbi:hypothetical protein [Aliagarivorans taiwanensis]|uniref:hypothetical protein n=1 Tax=Aliagarivorans taiwanensis TaxID=561966 RepID=UPI00047AA879|nr:hypothetical protein [Aliagarivorans taiwanensis]